MIEWRESGEASLQEVTQTIEALKKRNIFPTSLKKAAEAAAERARKEERAKRRKTSTMLALAASLGILVVGAIVALRS